MGTQRWTRERAWQWYDGRPWIRGFNFIPSNTINGVELWQEEGFDSVMETVVNELSFAAELGYNSVRMSLPFFVWKHQREGFKKRLGRFLDEARRREITMMPVLFSDCCVPRSIYREPHFGKQPDPIPGHFGGSVITPFDGTKQVGYIPADDEENWKDLELFVKDLLSTFGSDERVLMWDIWNEPGNSNRGDKSLRFMLKAFQWAREQDPIQPLTAGWWGNALEFPAQYLADPAETTPIEQAAIENSDILTYHYYGDLPHLRTVTEYLKQHELPMVNTEWLHRPFGSLIEDCLPFFKRERIGSYHFGFVNGKRQFNEPWDMIRQMDGIDLTLWMHDILYRDGRPYNESEVALIKSVQRE